MRELIIDGKRIADDTAPWVVAELGHNPAGNLSLAKEMVLAARDAGASAVKFQTRTPSEVYQANSKRGAYYYESDNPQWMHRVYGKHREALEFNENQWRELFGFCRLYGITAFSTPFDHKSADLLQSMNVRAFKIASGDATNIPLIEHVAAFGKPVIVSTGGCRWRNVCEVDLALLDKPHALLQCSCIYPAPDDVMNLNVIQLYREEFPTTVIGLSTHNRSWHTSLAAYTLGARIIEHHFTTDKSLKGTDNHFSLNPAEMSELVKACESVRQAMGSNQKHPDPREVAPTTERRKSLVWANSLKAGRIISRGDVTAKCPGDGIPPYEIEKFLGKVLSQDVQAEELVTEAQVAEKVYASR